MMPLTSLELTIDQSKPGWLPRAGRAGCALLTAQGRPQMASALRTEFAREPGLATLRRFVRLHLLAGSAPPRGTMAPVGVDGRFDGSRASDGFVPPHLPDYAGLAHPKETGRRRILSLGELVICQDVEAGRCRLAAYPLEKTERGALDLTAPLWTHWAYASWATMASDGEHLVALQRLDRLDFVLEVYDLHTGGQLWRRECTLPTAPRGLGLDFHLALSEGVVVVYAPSSCFVAAWDAGCGEGLWSAQAPRPGHPHPLLRLRGAHLCLGVLPDVHVFDLHSGTTRWATAVAGGQGSFCWADDKHLLLSHDEGLPIRYELASGARATSPHELNRPGDGRQEPKAAAAAGGLTLLEHADALFAVGPGPDHPVLWRRAVGGVHSAVVSLHLVGDTVLRSRGPFLSAYRLADGEPLWQNRGLPRRPCCFWGRPDGVLVAFENGSVGMLT